MADDRTPLVGGFNTGAPESKRILYALVSRGNVILAEETLGKQSKRGISGNFATVASKLLSKFPQSDGKNSYSYDAEHEFHLFSSDGLFYLCLAEQGVQLRIAYSLLSSLKEKFLSHYGERWQRANAYAMSDFSRVINGELKRFNDPESDKMYRLKGEISEVKDVMRNNINKVLERGEKIELLVDKSEQLAESAHVFHKRAKSLKWAMCRENAKLWGIIIFVILAIIGVIVSVACGGGGCGGGGGGGGGNAPTPGTWPPTSPGPFNAVNDGQF